jgi:hypothetical protein
MASTSCCLGRGCSPLFCIFHPPAHGGGGVRVAQEALYLYAETVLRCGGGHIRRHPGAHRDTAAVNGEG